MDGLPRPSMALYRDNISLIRTSKTGFWGFCFIILCHSVSGGVFAASYFVILRVGGVLGFLLHSFCELMGFLVFFCCFILCLSASWGGGGGGGLGFLGFLLHTLSF